jgi:hypothetical protein
VNAWCEVVAMVSSFLVSIGLLIAARNGFHLSTHVALIFTIAVTTVCWVLTAYVGPQTDRETLVAFYTRVRPFGPGWTPIREAAGLPGRVSIETGDNIPLALLGWVSGCTMIWSALFTVGNFLYGRASYAVALGTVFVVSGLIVLSIVGRLWSGGAEEAAASAAARRQ